MDSESLAERFEADRARLLAVAYRLLGSASEADDAVQEAWLRLSRAGASDVASLSGWLTTVVSRVCLDMLRSRRSRREEPLTPEGELIPDAASPEGEAVLAESVGLAMLSVLQRLAPAERVAFVLHDVFGVPFEEIAGIVGRTPSAARQLASRGRRRLQGMSASSHMSASNDMHAGSHMPAGRPTTGSSRKMSGDRDAGRTRQQEVVAAFFKASRDGDLAALLAVLDPDVVLRPDAAALQMGARSGWITSDLRGAAAVAEQFSGRAQAARPALLDGVPGGVWLAGGAPRVAFSFTLRNGRVSEIELIADAERLGGLQIEVSE